MMDEAISLLKECSKVLYSYPGDVEDLFDRIENFLDLIDYDEAMAEDGPNALWE